MREDNAMQSIQSNIPWYRARWFWGIIIGALIAWGLFFYFFTFNAPTRVGYWKFVDISYAFGGTPFLLYGNKLIGKSGAVIFTLIYYFIVFALLYKTFYKQQVRIFYPLIFVTLFLLGTFIGIFILSGL